MAQGTSGRSPGIVGFTLTGLEICRDGLDAVLARMARLAKIPSRPPVYKEIYASLFKRAGKPELALKQYEKMAHRSSGTSIHRKQAFALAKSGRDPEAIAESFVFTREVEDHFSVLADALAKDHGRGFFLQGDFGSGKSHFLAAFSTWLLDRPGAAVLSEHHSGLARVKASGRRILPVDISLLNYRATPLLNGLSSKT